MVVAPNASRLVSSTISRWLTASQTTTRRSRQEQSFSPTVAVGKTTTENQSFTDPGSSSKKLSLALLSTTCIPLPEKYNCRTKLGILPRHLVASGIYLAERNNEHPVET